jgi:hypothetical protein
MTRLTDGIYVDGLIVGPELSESPRSIVAIREGIISISLNPFGGPAFPQEHDSPVGRLRRLLTDVEATDDYVRVSHERLTERFRTDNGFASGIQWFDWETDEASRCARIADSWWSDFDVFLDLAHPRLLAGARLIGPTNWLVAVYNRRRHHDHLLGTPLLRIEVKGHPKPELIRSVRDQRDEIFRVLFDW